MYNYCILYIHSGRPFFIFIKFIYCLQKSPHILRGLSVIVSEGRKIVSLDLKEKYNKIYRYCYLRVNDRPTAEGITQEAFLRFIEHPQYRDIDEDIRILYTIAGNLCKDHFRKQTHDELPEDIPDDSADGEKLIEDISLHAALESLAPEDRELVLLRYVNEEPLGVISKLLGISRFSIDRRLKRILASLRSKLGKEDAV